MRVLGGLVYIEEAKVRLEDTMRNEVKLTVKFERRGNVAGESERDVRYERR